MKRFFYPIIVGIAVLISHKSLQANNVTIYAGPSFSKIGMNMGGMGYTPEMKFLTRFHAGIGYGIEINKNITLEPRLNFATKGFKSREIAATIDYDKYSEYLYSNSTLRLNYLETPILFKAVLPVDDKIKINAFAGPYLAIGLNGRAVSKYEGISYKEKYDVQFGDESGMRRFDMGIKLGGGFEYKSYTIQFFYDQGFLNIARGNGYESKSKNKSLGVSLGYILPTKQKTS